MARAEERTEVLSGFPGTLKLRRASPWLQATELKGWQDRKVGWDGMGLNALGHLATYSL